MTLPIEIEQSCYPHDTKIKFKVDPLALTLNQISSGRSMHEIGNLLHQSPASTELLVLKEDVQRANDIKKYYRNKLMMRTLKHSDKPMSMFRTDLYNYVSSNDPYTIWDTDIPMIIKLPDFYEEDQMMDTFTKIYEMSGKIQKDYEGTTRLYPLRKHQRKTTRTNNINFWFRDIANCVYRFSIDSNNQLLNLFEQTVFNQESVEITAYYGTTKVTGQDYVFYTPHNWKIA